MPLPRNKKTLKGYINPSFKKVVPKATKAFVKKVLKNQEEKKHKQYTGSSALANVWTDIHNLNQIAEGTGTDERVGNLIHPYYITGKYIAKANGAPTWSTMRIVILQDLQQVTGATIVAKSNVFRADLVYSARNRTYMSRYKILWDKTFTFNNTGHMIEKGNFKVKLHRPQHFSSSLDTSISKNGIYMIGISDQPTDLPLFSADLEVLYSE